MPTPDGISTEEWEEVHGLVLNIVNAETTDERARSQSRLFVFLDELEALYGALPSILATRADFVDDADVRLHLLSDAYFVAEANDDRTNMLYVSHSLAEFHLDERPNLDIAEQWLERMKNHLVGIDDQDMADSYQRLRIRVDGHRSRRSW